MPGYYPGASIKDNAAEGKDATVAET